VPLVKTAALLAECLADELHLVVAPFFVGGSGAPRFVSDARFPFDAAHPMTLAEVRQIGDVALLRYIINAEVASRVSAV
jgi:5-amino-6-(5-phosphoribosylamino)uracil reductase